MPNITMIGMPVAPPILMYSHWQALLLLCLVSKYWDIYTSTARNASQFKTPFWDSLNQVVHTLVPMIPFGHSSHRFQQQIAAFASHSSQRQSWWRRLKSSPTVPLVSTNQCKGKFNLHLGFKKHFFASNSTGKFPRPKNKTRHGSEEWLKSYPFLAVLMGSEAFVECPR